MNELFGPSAHTIGEKRKARVFMQASATKQLSLPKARKTVYVLVGLFLFANVVDLLLWAYRYLPILYAKVSGTLCGCEGKRDGIMAVIIALTIILFSATGSFITGLNYSVWFNSPPTKKWARIIAGAKYLVGAHLLLLLLRFVAGY